MSNETKGRREVLRVLGGLSALTLLRCTTNARGAAAETTSSAACQNVTNVTRGPFFVDSIADAKDAGASANAGDDHGFGNWKDPGIPERSDIRASSRAGGGKQPGLPLILTLFINDESTGACAPLPKARVDIWHCNAAGVYSDVNVGMNGGGEDLTGQDFLRGYQHADTEGKVVFTTVFPGAYRGRAVHLHLKIRVFDAAGNVTTETTSQLFFDEKISDDVYANHAAYASAAKDTTNATDDIFASMTPKLLVPVKGSLADGYRGAIALGIKKGTGSRGDEHPPGPPRGAPPWLHDRGPR